MKRKIGTALIGTAALALGGGVGSVLVTQSAAGAARTTTTQHLVMQAFAQLNSSLSSKDVKLFEATRGTGKLSGRIAVWSITIAQMGGSQPLEVALRAATCDDTNGFGAIEDVVVPQNQTVHVSYPSAARMPFVATAPTSWCLYASTVQDGSNLHVSVVATTL